MNIHIITILVSLCWTGPERDDSRKWQCGLGRQATHCPPQHHTHSHTHTKKTLLHTLTHNHRNKTSNSETATHTISCQRNIFIKCTIEQHRMEHLRIESARIREKSIAAASRCFLYFCNCCGVCFFFCLLAPKRSSAFGSTSDVDVEPKNELLHSTMAISNFIDNSFILFLFFMFAKREYSEPRFCEKTTQEPQMLRDHNNRTNIEYTKMHVC